MALRTTSIALIFFTLLALAAPSARAGRKHEVLFANTDNELRVYRVYGREEGKTLMIIGGILGVFFVTLLRRVMVEDRSLPFPESVAAAEIHKAGQRGAEAAMQLFGAMGDGALIKLVGDAGVFRASNTFTIAVGKVKESFIRLGLGADSSTIAAGGASTFQAPATSPAYLGVGYIIGPELASLTFAGGLLSWGLFVPLLIFVLGPELGDQYTGPKGTDWPTLAGHLWRYTVRPIAVGGMLVGAMYTLFRMRDKLFLGFKRGVADVKKSAAAHEATDRTDRDLSFKTLLIGILLIFVLMIALYFYFTKALPAAFFAAVVMIITGFFFAGSPGISWA